MYDLSTRLRDARRCSSERYSCSLEPAGRLSGRVNRMAGGTVSSTKASSDATPMVSSMASRPAASGPMCLDSKSTPSLLDEIGVLRGVQKGAGFRWVADLQHDEPGGVRIGVHRF